MASLKDIRKRIASVKNTQQITKAMKMVAAAKLRRAQDGVTQARPFATRIEGMLGDVLGRYEQPEDAPAPHPLLQPRDEIKRVELLVMTSDRGLCGGFNSNVTRAALRFLYDHSEAGPLETYDHIQVSTIGRKGRDFLARRPGVVIGSHHAGVFEDLHYGQAEAIASDLISRYLDSDLDAVYLLFNRFHSAISQEVTLTKLLPLAAPAASEGLAVDFKYEPTRDAVLSKLVPLHLTIQVWQALLESNASEHGARMSSMDSATRNAGEMIDSLTLVANRTRQAAITRELVEIVSGAEAL